MKRILNKAKNRLALATVLFSVGSFTSASAGILDLMRGEPAKPELQRVAFVGSAQVKLVDGSAQRLAGVDRWKALETGAQLKPGDVIRTENGTVVLRMSESQSFVKVTPNTVLRLVEIEKNWDRGVVSGEEERTGFVVRSCRGDAFFDAGNGRWKKLEVNDVLAPGTDLRTEAKTVVDLFHTSTKRPIRIPGSAQITLEDEVVAGGTRIQPSLAAAGR